MTELERVKSEIKVLEAKLSFLEELEKHKTPAEEAYKDTYGNYPMGEPFWIVFKKGYEAAQPKDAEVKECPDKYVELPTLYEIIADWWDEIFLHNNEAGETIESLAYTIEEDWFPARNNGLDSYACGWNDCIENLKLRLK